jgi:hypothetical protein
VKVIEVKQERFEWGRLQQSSGNGDSFQITLATSTTVRSTRIIELEMAPERQLHRLLTSLLKWCEPTLTMAMSLGQLDYEASRMREMR